MRGVIRESIPAGLNGQPPEYKSGALPIELGMLKQSAILSPMHCRTIEEQRAFQKRWMRQRRQSWIEANGPCSKCGSTIRLEVDHIDPSQKKVHVSSLWSLRQEKRNDELVKCHVLCHKCHRVKTSAELRAKCLHGTRSQYNLGCRCAPCRSMQSAR